VFAGEMPVMLLRCFCFYAGYFSVPLFRVFVFDRCRGKGREGRVLILYRDVFPDGWL
jgi:hypothetical protein